jgi:hypothetical protein
VPVASGAFEGKFRFEGTQGGHESPAFFTFEQFPTGGRAPSPMTRIDFEIITPRFAEDLDQRLQASANRHAAFLCRGWRAGDRFMSIASNGCPLWCAGSFDAHADPREEVANVPTKPASSFT